MSSEQSKLSLLSLTLPTHLSLFHILRSTSGRIFNKASIIFQTTVQSPIRLLEYTDTENLRSNFNCCFVQADLNGERSISTAVANARAEQWNVAYIETSAKDRTNVDRVSLFSFF